MAKPKKNLSLIEMARCLPIDADLPYAFRGEAVSPANYIQNRVFTRSTNKTPYELWYDSKPNLSLFHLFDSDCFVHVPSEEKAEIR